MHALEKPLILLREEQALVDIASYYSDTANLTINSVKVNVDSHLSDAKDLNYAMWNRLSIKATVKTIWDEYVKKQHEIEPYIEIPEPKPW